MNFTLKAQVSKKCPEGYRFDKHLGVCVPKKVSNIGGITDLSASLGNPGDFENKKFKNA